MARFRQEKCLQKFVAIIFIVVATALVSEVDSIYIKHVSDGNGAVKGVGKGLGKVGKPTMRSDPFLDEGRMALCHGSAKYKGPDKYKWQADDCMYGKDQSPRAEYTKDICIGFLKMRYIPPHIKSPGSGLGGFGGESRWAHFKQKFCMSAEDFKRYSKLQPLQPVGMETYNQDDGDDYGDYNGDSDY